MWKTEKFLAKRASVLSSIGLPYETEKKILLIYKKYLLTKSTKSVIINIDEDESGWKTINGAPVLVNSSGDIVSGAGGNLSSKSSTVSVREPVFEDGGGTTEKCTGFASAEKLADHAARHGAREMGLNSEAEYQEKAAEFLSQATGGNIKGYTCADGKVVRFNEVTTEYATGYPGSVQCTYMLAKYSKSSGTVNVEAAKNYYEGHKAQDRVVSDLITANVKSGMTISAAKSAANATMASQNSSSSNKSSKSGSRNNRGRKSNSS